MRVLHVGNIANNAFCAAYMDRAKNIEAFVVNPHLSDSIATPIWEFPLDDRDESELISEIQSWYCAGNWKHILDAWDGDRFVCLSDSTVSNSALRNFYITRKSSVKRLIPRSLHSFISNEIIYRIRRLRQPNLENFFRNFDVVILYGPFAVLKRFVTLHSLCITFEHGTLEHFCRGPYKYCQDALNAFKDSTDIMITNQGGLAALKSFGITSVKLHKTPHPSLDFGLEFFRSQRQLMIQNLVRPNYLLAPSRHASPNKIDPGKGNLEIFRSFKMLLSHYPQLKLLCISHGDDLKLSMSEVKLIGIESSVVWLPLQTRYELKKLMAESICVVDQLNSSSYGTITSDALLLGIPVLTSHDCKLDIHYFGECAPVIDCKDANDIYFSVKNLMESKKNPIFAFQNSIEWGERHLSAEKAFEVRNKIYATRSNKTNS